MKLDFSVMLLLSLKLLQCHGLSEILRSTTKTRKSIQPIYKCQIAEVENRIRCYDLFFSLHIIMFHALPGMGVFCLISQEWSI